MSKVKKVFRFECPITGKLFKTEDEAILSGNIEAKKISDQENAEKL